MANFDCSNTLAKVEESSQLLLSFCETVHDSAPESAPSWLHVVFHLARRIEAGLDDFRQEATK